MVVIIRLTPHTQFRLLDVTIQEQLLYYGHHCAHVLTFYQERLK